MANFKMESSFLGHDIQSVAEKAKTYAKQNGTHVEFEFNGRTCIINDKTVIEWFVRDFMNSFVMDWKTIGPDCVMQYDVDTEIELRKKQLANAEERKQSLIAMNEADEKERQEVDLLVKDIKIDLLPGKEQEYADHVEANSKDGYSRAVVDYSEYWAKLMQKEMAKGKSLHEIADSTQSNLGFLGITGFQYGCAVKVLAHVWVHGAELKKWHNKQYGVGEDEKGVVNPAIMTVNL